MAWLERLCRAAARTLDCAGVGVAVSSPDRSLLAVAASGPATTVLQELELTLGEGPSFEAIASGVPVLVPDLAASAVVARWPGYVPAAGEHGAGSVFAFPLRIGVARLGVLVLVRSVAAPLTPAALDRALSFADVATDAVLQGQQTAVSGQDGTALDAAFDDRFQLYQAQGMVMVQLGVDLEGAMARLRAYAYARGRPLGEVADDVVARRLTLTVDET